MGGVEKGMAYTDRWDTFTNGVVTVGLDTVTKLIGSASLAIAVNNTSAQVNMVPTLTGGLPQPALRGKVRMLLRAVDLGGGRKFGLAAVQSVRNITISGSAYLAFFSGSLLVLGKITSGLSSGGVTVLEEKAFTLVVGKDYVLEFEWNVDNTQLSGADLVVRAGTVAPGATGQSNIDTFFESALNVATTLHKIDKSSPLLTTLGYGPIFYTPGSPSTVDVRYDSTILYAV